MATKAEKAIVTRRKAAATGAILVPILERLLEDEVRVETEDDYRFVEMLLRARALPRESGVFSPSQLASCKRQIFFAKRGVKKIKPRDSQMNGYFLHGDFIHLKWQFALWRANTLGLLELVHVPAEASYLNFYDDGTRPAVEVRVVDGDYGGTIDAMVKVGAKRGARPVIVDFKGLRQEDYMKTVRQGPSRQYRNQIVGYGKLANSVLDLGIEDCLLVAENKSGPMTGRGSPIALHESRVSIADHEAEVERRLRTLRHYHDKDVTPAAECVSTLHQSFQSCSFNRLCRDEVLTVQRERERQARKRTRPAAVARPTREA